MRRASNPLPIIAPFPSSALWAALLTLSTPITASPSFFRPRGGIGLRWNPAKVSVSLSGPGSGPMLPSMGLLTQFEATREGPACEI
jgi:hypothetical protein